MWKRVILLIFILCTVDTAAQSVSGGSVSVSDIVVDKQADTLSVRMVLNVSSLKLKGAQSLALTPILRTAGHSRELPSVEIMGGKQYIYYLRNKKTGSTEVHRRNANALQFIPYTASLPYEPWMGNAQLYLSESRRRCCVGKASHETLLVNPEPARERTGVSEEKVFKPVYAYMKPDYSRDAGAKIRSVKGHAYISFPVNRWEVMENYENNASELYKIYRTIDNTRASEDYGITAIRLTGFASPESSWAHNAKLAKNRTEALKHYLCEHLSISPELIHTYHVAEDWAGLREFVKNSSLTRKEEMLSLIDSDFLPDTKEFILKRDYPAQYRILVQDCFPLLRHTDYVIEYQVKTYHEKMHLEKVFGERPSDLSLQEFYLLASNYDEGSERFIKVFETAALLYPDDAASNLNAGVAALVSGHYARAAAYLSLAGNSPEAINARGILAYHSGEKEKAYLLFSQAAAGGLEAAVQNAQSIILNFLSK